ncbi:MAG: hypothetical protein FWG66_10980 [Spirochaetes bacterium]|nr:hypothetical protein [Spirochaetota bacterium]
MITVEAKKDTEVSAETVGRIPNAVTLAAMQEAEAMITGEKPCVWYKSPEEFIEALKNEVDALNDD